MKLSPRAERAHQAKLDQLPEHVRKAMRKSKKLFKTYKEREKKRHQGAADRLQEALVVYGGAPRDHRFRRRPMSADHPSREPSFSLMTEDLLSPDLSFNDGLIFGLSVNSGKKCIHCGKINP